VKLRMNKLAEAVTTAALAACVSAAIGLVFGLFLRGAL